MVHPATLRMARAAVAALAVPLDIGFVFPPPPHKDRGYGQWTNRDLGAAEILSMLPRAAAANTRGGNVFMRLGPGAGDRHPGLVMLDDLTDDAVGQLAGDGLEPCLVVETSPKNHQGWIRLIGEGTLPYALAGAVVRTLAERYGADPRAVSPRQPGRLPGFTNRKPRHRRDDGSYPFVKLLLAEPGRVTGGGEELLARLAGMGTAPRAAGGAPKPLPAAAAMVAVPAGDAEALDAIRVEQQRRLAAEVAAGSRPPTLASASELDFACVRAALRAGLLQGSILPWLEAVRPEKPTGYARRTLERALEWRLPAQGSAGPGDWKIR